MTVMGDVAEDDAHVINTHFTHFTHVFHSSQSIHHTMVTHTTVLIYINIKEVNRCVF